MKTSTKVMTKKTTKTKTTTKATTKTTTKEHKIDFDDVDSKIDFDDVDFELILMMLIRNARFFLENRSEDRFKTRDIHFFLHC
jgi:hypothetical protein